MPPDPTPRRWAVLTHHYAPAHDGSAKTGTNLSRELADRGNDVVVLTRAYDEAPAGVAIEDGIEVRRYEPRMWRHWHLPHAGYRRDVERLDVDAVVLVHQNTWMSNQVVDLWPRIPARRVYLPIEFDPAWSKGFARPWIHRLWNRTLNRRLMTTSHLVVGVTQTETDALREFLGRPTPVATIPLGVDPDVFKAPDDDLVQARWPDLPDGFILHACSRRANKRRDLAVEVARTRLGHRHWVFAGAGSEAVDVPNAHAVGFVSPDELRALYARAHVHLQTSEAEGFGYTLLESLAQGTPFVAGPVGIAQALAIAGGGVVVDEREDTPRTGLIQRFADGVEEAYRRTWESDRLRNLVAPYTWTSFVDRLETLTFDDRPSQPDKTLKPRSR